MDTVRVNPLICKEYRKEITSLSNKNRHLRKIHKHDSPYVERRPNIMCSLSPNEYREKFPSFNDLYKHFTNIHNMKITESTTNFRSHEEFEAWQGEENRHVNCACTWAVENEKADRIVYYYCNRSDYRRYQSNCVKCNVKLGGSIHIQGICPSRFSFQILTDVNFPRNNNYSDPKLFGLDGARNLVLDNNGVKLGVWQILPTRLVKNKTDKKYFEMSLKNGQNVIIYNHGNAGSRATEHRLEMYKFLRNYFHVITFDYRGYGDSSTDPQPTEIGVVEDSLFIVNWVRSKISEESRLFLWGHSLGSSITLSAVKALKKQEFVPTGVILESPFNNVREEISESPPAVLFRHLPWFDACVVEPIIENGIRFQSDEYILDVDCPILILHAEDDRTVPYKLGKKLFETASEKRLDTQGSVQLETFPKKFHYGHKYIVNAPELPNIIQNFIKSSINETTTLQL